jgi:hypothetical protein
MSSVLLHSGPPADGEVPDKVNITFKTPNQAFEFAAKVKAEAESMAHESRTGMVTAVGRFRK